MFYSCLSPYEKQNEKYFVFGIVDSLSVRFLLDLDLDDVHNSERLFFILEEAHWFLMDNYGIKNILLGDFVNIILEHNDIKINVGKALTNFVRYRQSIKVFGAILFNRNLDKILVVKEHRKAKNYGLPKGKKSKDEDGISCAIREVYEETSYDIRNKVVEIPITIFDKITFYFVFNVPEETHFKALSKSEICEISWLEITKIEELQQDKKFTLITRAYAEWKQLHSLIVKNRFTFDKKPFEKIIKKIVCG